LKKKSHLTDNEENEKIIEGTELWEADDFALEETINQKLGASLTLNTDYGELQSGFKDSGGDRFSIVGGQTCFVDTGRGTMGAKDRELQGTKGGASLGKLVDTGRLFSDEKVPGENKVLLSSKSASSKGGSGAKFKILCIGDLMTTRNGDVSLGVIGYGPTVCIRKNCHKNHLGGKTDLKHNNICVIELNDTSLFSEPTMLREQVQPSLFLEWMSDKATL
jgi:hypothetical protein